MQKPLIIVGAVLLSACSQSPQDRFLASCKKSKAVCECLSDTLSRSISDHEFDQFLDEMAILTEKKDGGEKIGSLILTGSLVNENVSKAVIKSSKICSE